MEPRGLKSFSADQPEGSEGKGRDTTVAVAIFACGSGRVKILISKESVGQSSGGI